MTKKNVLRGFTLIELMITVVIIGILASFAIPVYIKSVERGKMGEAYQILGALRNSAIRYYNQYLDWPTDVRGTDFSGTIHSGSGMANPSRYTGKYFVYALEDVPSNRVRAGRRGDVENPNGRYDYNVILYENGTYATTGNAP